jgi:hypothetical protein
MIRCDRRTRRGIRFRKNATRWKRPIRGRCASCCWTRTGVLCVEPSGATLHLFLNAGRTSPAVLGRKLEQNGRGPAVFQRIVPSLEDVFIALVRKEEKAA